MCWCVCHQDGLATWCDDALFAAVGCHFIISCQLVHFCLRTCVMLAHFHSDVVDFRLHLRKFWCRMPRGVFCVFIIMTSLLTFRFVCMCLLCAVSQTSTALISRQLEPDFCFVRVNCFVPDQYFDIAG